MKKEIRVLTILVFFVIFSGPLFAAEKIKEMILATTTSTQDSGLLDVLIPRFEKETAYFVKTIAVGSGQAMAMGQKGEADVLVMHNDFVIVGPADDPAKIKGVKTTLEAFKRIAEAGKLFLSRGDNSGTNA